MNVFEQAIDAQLSKSFVSDQIRMYRCTGPRFRFSSLGTCRRMCHLHCNARALQPVRLTGECCPYTSRLVDKLLLEYCTYSCKNGETKFQFQSCTNIPNCVYSRKLYKEMKSTQYCTVYTDWNAALLMSYRVFQHVVGLGIYFCA